MGKLETQVSQAMADAGLDDASLKAMSADMMGGLMGNGRRRLLNMHGGSGKDLKGMMGDMMGSMGSGKEGMEGMMSTMMGGMGSGKEGMEGMMSTMMGNMMGSSKAMEMEGMDALGS